MKSDRTWVGYLAVAVFVAFIVAGVAIVVTFAAVALSMNNFGSNK